jgi:hypothetical protein
MSKLAGAVEKAGRSEADPKPVRPHRSAGATAKASRAIGVRPLHMTYRSEAVLRSVATPVATNVVLSGECRTMPNKREP